jgi:hypothetical protein
MGPLRRQVSAFRVPLTAIAIAVLGSLASGGKGGSGEPSGFG